MEGNSSSDTTRNSALWTAGNSSKRELYRIVVPLMLTMCLVSMVFNVVIVSSVKWVRRTVSPTLCFSLSLAAADAYASLILGLGLVVNSLLPEVYGTRIRTRCLALILEAFRLGGLSVSVYHLLALTLNHYVGIVRPLHYAATVTRRTVAATVTGIWMGSLCFFFLYFSSVHNQGFQSPYCGVNEFYQLSTFRIIVSTFFFLPMVSMTAVYCHIFFVVRQHQQRHLQVPSSRQLHRSVKAVVTTLLILGTYLLCWMPAVLFFAVSCLDCVAPYTQIPETVLLPVGIVTNSLIILKSLVNPIIYAARMPEIREALHAMVPTNCEVRPLRVMARQRTLLRRASTFSTSTRMASFRCSTHNQHHISRCDESYT
ncbi:melanocyte-stimulating hormone receptor-like [Limulus polyphemus]|uniref:Melanocyte-stimulating hormone receptor-like n=1 Tax=Limulus polyphemus TaxID=6850 RepID=A0ABM1BUP4_LIMPO|nr:melanocyte-stimulating hormone receptor-like [Limulus polyphemus]